MELRFLRSEIKIKSKMLVAVTILVASSLSWSFFMLFAFENIFINIIGKSPAYFGLALFLFFGAISAIIGSLISERVNRRKFLWFWIILGVISSLSALTISEPDFIWFSSLLLGISLGLGYPSFTAVLGDCTIVEERARVSGLIIFITFIIVICSAGVVTNLNLGLLGVVFVGVSLRLLTGFALILESCEKKKAEKKSWLNVLTARDFSSYLIPWLMFNIAVGLTSFIFAGLPETEAYAEAYSNGNYMHYLGAAFGSVIAGFIADRIGRKKPIMFAMVILAISFGFLGLATSEQTLFLYLTISGFAWGFLIVVYLAVPGDISFVGGKEKFYALGIVLPLIIYAGLGSLSMLLDIKAPAESLSSILAIIIALLIIPVYNAQETLPKEKRHKREMKEHIDKIGRLIQESKKKK